MIKVTMFRASYGDSFLMQLIQPNGSENILIDCGFGSTYTDYLKDALEKLNTDGGILERLIITHLDRDHINGAVPLLLGNGSNELNEIIPIRQIWHNTLRHMQSSKLPVASYSPLETARLESFIIEHQLTNETGAETPISAAKSSELGSLILHGKYQWNTDFEEKAVVIDHKKTILITDNISITLLGPSLERLEDVEYLFKISLAKIGVDLDKRNDVVDDAFEVYIRNKKFKPDMVEGPISRTSPYEVLTTDLVKELSGPDLYEPDDAEPNGSSITFIIHTEGKQLLFLADAFAEDVLKELNTLTGHDGFFDLIKISHHGAHKNTSPALLSKIDSERYLISTNGEHPKHLHPDAETIARIINRPLRKGKKKRTLFFNYLTPTAELFRNEALKEYFHYDVQIAGEIEL